MPSVRWQRHRLLHERHGVRCAAVAGTSERTIITHPMDMKPPLSDESSIIGGKRFYELFPRGPRMAYQGRVYTRARGVRLGFPNSCGQLCCAKFTMIAAQMHQQAVRGFVPCRRAAVSVICLLLLHIDRIWRASPSPTLVIYKNKETDEVSLR